MSYQLRTIPTFDNELVVYFLSIYDKSEQSTITDKRIKQLLKEAGIK